MPRWTPESRRKQSEIIRRWRPWEQSTGPQTDFGKERSSRNAWKGSHRPMITAWHHLLRSFARAGQAVTVLNRSKVLRGAKVISSFCQKTHVMSSQGRRAS